VCTSLLLYMLVLSEFSTVIDVHVRMCICAYMNEHMCICAYICTCVILCTLNACVFWQRTLYMYIFVYKYYTDAFTNISTCTWAYISWAYIYLIAFLGAFRKCTRWHINFSISYGAMSTKVGWWVLWNKIYNESKRVETPWLGNIQKEIKSP